MEVTCIHKCLIHNLVVYFSIIRFKKNMLLILVYYFIVYFNIVYKYLNGKLHHLTVWQMYLWDIITYRL